MAGLLTVLLGITGLAALAAAGAVYRRSTEVERLLGAPSAPDADLTRLADADRLVRLAGMGLGGLAILTALAWIAWQYRHAENAEALHPGGNLGPGLALTGWFIPLVQLVLPPMQLAEAAKASDPSLGADDPRSAGQSPDVIWLWWLAFVGGVTAASIGSGQRAASGEVDTSRAAARWWPDLVRADQVTAGAMVTLAAAAFLGVTVALLLSRRQRARFDLAAAAGDGVLDGPGPPVPSPWQPDADPVPLVIDAARPSGRSSRVSAPASGRVPTVSVSGRSPQVAAPASGPVPSVADAPRERTVPSMSTWSPEPADAPASRWARSGGIGSPGRPPPGNPAPVSPVPRRRRPAAADPSAPRPGGASRTGTGSMPPWSEPPAPSERPPPRRPGPWSPEPPAGWPLRVGEAAGSAGSHLPAGGRDHPSGEWDLGEEP